MTDTPILRALSAAVGVADSAPDDELLRRFAEAGDRSAFELVVRRHAELVWGVCLATLARDRHAAEDAFQAAFLALARTAASVRDASAAGWLFRVARNAAVRAGTRAAQRKTEPLPESLAAAAESAEEAAVRREVAPLVAEEVARLASALREPVVLCFFEGHTHAEAAARLGWPVGTVASRLARAKDLLRDRLTRRGVVLPAAGGAAVLAAPPATAAPPMLIHSTVATIAGPVGRASPAVLSLTEGVLSAMRLTQLKPFAAVAVVLALTAALAALPHGRAGASGTAPAPSASVAAPSASPVWFAPQKDDKEAKEREAREKELEAKDLKALQGKWRTVKCELPGKELAAEELVGLRTAIEDDVMASGNGDPKTEMKWKLKLAPGKSPKEMDSTAAGGSLLPKGTTNPGIYKLEGDTLTTCFPIIGLPLPVGERPKEFKGEKGNALTVFERVKDEKGELEALAGEWKPVKVVERGKEVKAEEAGRWVINGAEITAAGKEWKIAIKLDPAAVPPTIDLTVADGPGAEGRVSQGIYFRQGDKLTMAFGDPKEKDNRPSELKPGDDVAFVVLERAPKK